VRVVLTDPSLPGFLAGNHSTVRRWRSILRELGCEVVIHRIRDPQRGPLPCGDLLIALHAGHSHRAILRWKKRDEKLPVVVAVSGTDLYIDLPAAKTAAKRVIESFNAADHLVALHRGVEDQLPGAVGRRLKGRVHYIPQSARPLSGGRRPIESRLRLLVVGYLRRVKDPFLPLEALELLPDPLPDGTRAEVVHLGGIHERSCQERAICATRDQPRWRWLGPVSAARVRGYLATSHLLVHPSLDEGGANIISEALVAGIPILASDAPGNMGLLGDRHPGIFPRKDAAELARLVMKYKHDPRYRRSLEESSRQLGRGHFRSVETARWKRLLALLG